MVDYASPLTGKSGTGRFAYALHENFFPGGPAPEKEDRTMLLRRRISRIFYLKKFFDYPVTFNAKTILNLGLGRTVRAAIGYLRATLSKVRRSRCKSIPILTKCSSGSPLPNKVTSC